MMALTDKQKRFADEYLIDMNGTAAYLRAGYNCKEEVARANASRLLTKANIVEYIESKQVKLEEKTEMTVEWILMQYKTIIENNIQVDPNIAKGALDSVAKHRGMFKERVEISGSLSIEQLLELV
jgi:phage terminase small subunit